jgi:hypothetical protein
MHRTCAHGAIDTASTGRLHLHCNAHCFELCLHPAGGAPHRGKHTHLGNAHSANHLEFLSSATHLQQGFHAMQVSCSQAQNKSPDRDLFSIVSKLAGRSNPSPPRVAVWLRMRVQIHEMNASCCCRACRVSCTFRRAWCAILTESFLCGPLDQP